MRQYLVEARDLLVNNLSFDALRRKGGVRCFQRRIFGKGYVAFLKEDMATVIDLLRWSPQGVVELPTCEATARLLKPSAAVQWEPRIVHGYFSGKAGDCLKRLSAWWATHPTHKIYPLSMHYSTGTWEGKGLFEPGRLHVCLSKQTPPYRHRDLVSSWPICYQISHLWLNSELWRVDKTLETTIEILSESLPRIQGAKWWSGTVADEARMQYEIKQIRNKPYVLAGWYKGNENKLGIVTSKRAEFVQGNVRYDFGEIEIEIDLSSKELEAVRVTPLSYPCGDRNLHPHLFFNGTLCWGTAADTVLAYLWAGAYAALLDLTWMFLNTTAPNAGVYAPCYSLDHFDTLV